MHSNAARSVRLKQGGDQTATPQLLLHAQDGGLVDVQELCTHENAARSARSKQGRHQTAKLQLLLHAQDGGSRDVQELCTYSNAVRSSLLIARANTLSNAAP